MTTPDDPKDAGGTIPMAQAQAPQATSAGTRRPAAAADSQLAADICPRCSESMNLALIKGCLRCMRCGFKWDCNGW